MTSLKQISSAWESAEVVHALFASRLLDHESLAHQRSIVLQGCHSTTRNDSLVTTNDRQPLSRLMSQEASSPEPQVSNGEFGGPVKAAGIANGNNDGTAGSLCVSMSLKDLYRHPPRETQVAAAAAAEEEEEEQGLGLRQVLDAEDW